MARRQTTRTQRVVAEDPPNDSMWQRTSFWVLVFEDARKEDRWFRVERFYTATTAAQLASDIRSASRRPLDKLRVRDEKCPPGNFSIWVRLIKSSD